MDANKAYFIERANRYGILVVRERNPREDLTGWGALEFILNNGEIFVISGYPFGQSEGEDGLWVDLNVLDREHFRKIKATVLRRETCEVDPDKSARDYLSHKCHSEGLM